MALSDIDLAKLKVDFHAGKLSQRKLAQKHRISRNTLSKYAKEGKWEFGKNEPTLSQAIEEGVYKKLVDSEIDRATKITDNFLKDVEKYRKLASKPAEELFIAYEEADNATTKEKRVKVSKEEFSRIWESTKAMKAAIETLRLGYEGARKALGMDKDDDIEKARKIKHGDVDGVGSNKLQERIKEKMKANGFDD
jgi:DNA-binding Xre family transcriptional regulator